MNQPAQTNPPKQGLLFGHFSSLFQLTTQPPLLSSCEEAGEEKRRMFPYLQRQSLHINTASKSILLAYLAKLFYVLLKNRLPKDYLIHSWKWPVDHWKMDQNFYASINIITLQDHICCHSHPQITPLLWLILDHMQSLFSSRGLLMLIPKPTLLLFIPIAWLCNAPHFYHSSIPYHPALARHSSLPL